MSPPRLVFDFFRGLSIFQKRRKIQNVANSSVYVLVTSSLVKNMRFVEPPKGEKNNTFEILE